MSLEFAQLPLLPYSASLAFPQVSPESTQPINGGTGVHISSVLLEITIQDKKGSEPYLLLFIYSFVLSLLLPQTSL